MQAGTAIESRAVCNTCRGVTTTMARQTIQSAAKALPPNLPADGHGSASNQ